MIENKIADSWCRRISNAARFQITGSNSEWISMQPCCLVWTPGCTVVSLDDITRIRKDIVDQVHQNKNLICGQCIHREKIPNDKRSVRQLGDIDIPVDAKWGEIQLLEFQIDIRCNAACVMCGPHFSTLWQQELNQPVTLNEKKVTDTLNKLMKLIDWEPVRTIYFSGGEPLLTSAHETILSYVPDLSKVQLKYQTNGSVMPSTTALDLWRQVGKIKLEISLDGTDEQYEYVRYPLKWPAVDRNVNSLATFLEDNSIEYEIHINYAVNPLNLMYLHRMDQWFLQLQKKYKSVKGLEYAPTFGPYWALDSIDATWIDRFTKIHGINHPAIQLFQDLKHDPDKKEKLARDLELLDSRRKLNWRHSFADSVEFFE